MRRVPDDCVHVDDPEAWVRGDEQDLVAEAIRDGVFDAIVYDLVRAGRHDDAVLERARALGWSAPDEARADAEAEIQRGVAP